MASLVSIALFVLGFLVLGVNLRTVQLDESAALNGQKTQQSVRRVQTAAPRGRILDRHGAALADNRASVAIVLNATAFQGRTWEATEQRITNALAKVSAVIGLPVRVSNQTLSRHIRQALAMPLTCWRDVDSRVVALFSEHERDFPGFSLVESEERVYPAGSTAAHAIGYVGRAEGEALSGDRKFNFSDRELRGRSGLERYYDSYLRGVSGERELTVDARGFTQHEQDIKAARRGLDLQLNLDLELQRAAEKALEGQRGACVVMDVRDGAVLAFASAPGYNPNDFVPSLSPKLYTLLAEDPAKPLLNRVSGGSYAPGSTFKPITALAALEAGVPETLAFTCTGFFEFGHASKLRCAARWGHGEETLKTALRDSCNPYFCNLGLEVGTNALMETARAFGLGSATGIDLGVDVAGVVPDDGWKRRQYQMGWTLGDTVQMSIGQSMLLVSPLQMARVAAGVATGILVKPRLAASAPVDRTRLPFTDQELATVREGMWLVVNDPKGSGRRARSTDFITAGKTGTAEVGSGERRHKNTWFIAFAPYDHPEVAVAMVIENGTSGGGTTAPRVADVLRKWWEVRS